MINIKNQARKQKEENLIIRSNLKGKIKANFDQLKYSRIESAILDKYKSRRIRRKLNNNNKITAILIIITISILLIKDKTYAKLPNEYLISNINPVERQFVNEYKEYQENRESNIINEIREVSKEFEQNIVDQEQADEDEFNFLLNNRSPLNIEEENYFSNQINEKGKIEAQIKKGYEDELIVQNEKIRVFPQIRIYSNTSIERFVKMYTGRKRKTLDLAVKRYPKYMPMLYEIFSSYNLPPQLVNLAIVESNLNSRAVSRAYAVGMWQFISSTGRNYGLANDFYYDERLNIEKSTHAAARLLRDLYSTFNDWELALAAYNSGPGTVRRAIKRNQRQGKPTNFWNLRLPRETSGYVPAFYAVNIIFNDPAKYGIDERLLSSEYRPTYVQHKKISVPPSIKFSQIAKRLGIKEKELISLNPEYKMKIIPPLKRDYTILVPVDLQVSANYYSQFTTDSIPNMLKHKIRRGETYSSIAKRYGVSIRSLRQLNPKTTPRRLQIGKTLLVAVNSNNSNKYATNGNTYRVVRGDNLSSISSAFGISLNKLLSLNKTKVSRNRILAVGTVLRIR